MIKEIITDLNELSHRCDEVNVREKNDEVRLLVLDLKDTIRDHKNCVGLAANQIGSNIRMFCINFNGDIRTFINPVITEAKGITLNRESCMSLPGKEFIRPRNSQVSVIYQTPLGKTESVTLNGLAACVFQHELDHLDGVVLSDLGMEIDENFDKASEEERNELIKAYLDSLDLKQKEVQSEIDKDPELKQIKDASLFMDKVISGEIKIEHEKVDKETSDKITEKLKNSSK
jgi:peptide deformylase